MSRHSDVGSARTRRTFVFQRGKSGIEHRINLRTELLEERRLLSVTPTLLKDIYSGSTDSSSPSDLAVVGDMLYFAANDYAAGRELFKSDGTPAGTSLVADLVPGFEGSSPTKLTAVGSKVFFVATDQAHGSELWVSDGTANGTQFLRDIAPGAASSSIASLTNVNGTLFFTANDGTHGFELWKSDGTTVGTTLVKEIAPDAASAFSSVEQQQELVNVAGNLYFVASEDAKTNLPSVNKLWKSDGTLEGTVVIDSVYSPANLTEMSGVLYFSASGTSHGIELWRTDGTNEGTTMVHDIAPGSGPSTPKDLVNVGGTLYFTATDSLLLVPASGHARELWKSDGTSEGTLLVRDIRTDTYAPLGNPTSSDPEGLTNVGGTLFFIANDGVHGSELWKSDGTEAGTQLVQDTTPGTNSTFYFLPSTSFVDVNGRLFFTQFNKLWTSDGTDAGTRIVRDDFVSTAGNVLENLINFNGTLFFTASRVASDGDNELWTSDGTPEGTHVAIDVNQEQSTNSRASQFTSSNGYVYFSANDGINGNRLWRTDGTTAGTTMVADIYSGPGNPHNFVELNGTLYFFASSESMGTDLWKTDGTAEGTVPVTDLAPGNSYAYPSFATLFDGAIYFELQTSPDVGELWKSDGTPEGTVLVHTFATNSGGRAIIDLAVAGNTLYLSAFDELHGIELWKTDGTDEGTQLVRDINPGADDSSIGQMTNLGGSLLFFANDGTHGSQLWKSDGTDAGTVLLKEVNSSGSAVGGGGLTVIGNKVYFGVNGKIWTSDGTDIGTHLVLNGYDPGYLTNVNGLLYFSQGTELWKTDGTPEGTERILDSGQNISQPTVLDGKLFFFLDKGNSEGPRIYQLWSTDGTYDGTQQLYTFTGNVYDPKPTLTNANGQLFIVAPSFVGTEPWILAPTPTAKLFYNNSLFDGDDPAATTGDDGAIASDKTPYISGAGAATFDSVSSYANGINGLMLDFAGSRPNITAADFEFKVGNNNSPESWGAAPPPTTISIRPADGDGGGDRVEVLWADGAIKNTWLQVTVLPSTRTGLTEPYVFYFGSRVGDTGTGGSYFETTTTDSMQVFATQGTGKLVTDLRDFNRDGVVNSTDSMLVFANLGTLIRLDLPGPVQNLVAAPAVGVSSTPLATIPRDPGLRQAVASAIALAHLKDELTSLVVVPFVDFPGTGESAKSSLPRAAAGDSLTAFEAFSAVDSEEELPSGDALLEAALEDLLPIL